MTLAAIDTRNDEMLAVLQAVVIKGIGGILGSFSAQSIIQGGPLFIENGGTMMRKQCPGGLVGIALDS